MANVAVLNTINKFSKYYKMKNKKQKIDKSQSNGVLPYVRHSTSISDKANTSIDSEGNEDFETLIYELGLLLDKKIPLKGLTNAQRIEIALREYCD